MVAARPHSARSTVTEAGFVCERVVGWHAELLCFPMHTCLQTCRMTRSRGPHFLGLHVSSIAQMLPAHECCRHAGRQGVVDGAAARPAVHGRCEASARFLGVHHKSYAEVLPGQSVPRGCCCAPACRCVSCAALPPSGCNSLSAPPCHKAPCQRLTLSVPLHFRCVGGVQHGARVPAAHAAGGA